MPCSASAKPEDAPNIAHYEEHHPHAPEETSIEKHLHRPFVGLAVMKAPPGDGQAHRQTDEREPAVPPPAPATVQNACLVQPHAQQHHRGRTEGQHG